MSIILRNEAIKTANSNGINYINSWIKENIIKIVHTSSNWFYIGVIREGKMFYYAISQKYNCESTTFGNQKHFDKVKSRLDIL